MLFALGVFTLPTTSVILHQPPESLMNVKEPVELGSKVEPRLYPPGIALKPLLLFAPVFGLVQCNVPVSFILPAAIA